MKHIFIISVVAILFGLIGFNASSRAWQERVAILELELNQKIPNASDSKEQYCERMWGSWQETRDLLAN
jgi:hypothetical protein